MEEIIGGIGGGVVGKAQIEHGASQMTGAGGGADLFLDVVRHAAGADAQHVIVQDGNLHQRPGGLGGQAGHGRSQKQNSGFFHTDLKMRYLR